MNNVRGLALPIILVLIVLVIGLTAVVLLGDVDESDVSDEQGDKSTTQVVPTAEGTPESGTPDRGGSPTPGR